MIYKKGQLPNLYLAQGVRKLDDDLLRYLNDQDANLASILINGINFSDNFDGTIANYVTDAGSGEDVIPHGLNRVPIGWIICRKPTLMDIYESGTPFDTTNIYLQATAGSQPISVLIF